MNLIHFNDCYSSPNNQSTHGWKSVLSGAQQCPIVAIACVAVLHLVANNSIPSIV